MQSPTWKSGSFGLAVSRTCWVHLILHWQPHLPEVYLPSRQPFTRQNTPRNRSFVSSATSQSH
ncbi:hypothetical protein ACSBR2_026535 [Camellia fascicularis]